MEQNVFDKELIYDLLSLLWPNLSLELVGTV